MTLTEMIPDRPGRGVAFEPLLDELLPIFCPDWQMPQTVEGESQYHRCEVKRFRIGQAAEENPGATRQNADLLVRAAVHDQCRSGVNQLVRPLVAALGHRSVQQALIGYVRAGGEAEKVGATMAWYWAQPGLVYDSSEALRRREPTPESLAIWEALADLRKQYRSACLIAFLANEDPDFRQDLSLGITLDPGAYPEDLQEAVEQALHIVTADPERYRRVLSGHDATRGQITANRPAPPTAGC